MSPSSGPLEFEPSGPRSPPSSERPDPAPEPPRDFAALVRAEIAFVWRQLRREGLSRQDADDATQQVFLVTARKFPDLPAGKERSFLYGTALRVAANVRRTLRRRRELPESAAPIASAREQPADELLERQQARALLDRLLGELPEELRRVLVLAEVEQLTLAAIAELEAIPPGTAASRLRRARERFRGLLAGHEQQNPFPREPA